MAVFSGGFADIVVRTEPEVTVSYRSAKLVVEEGMRDGRWVTLSYNAAGYLMAANDRPAPPYMNVDSFAEPQSFALNVDGQDLCSHWRYEGTDVTEELDCIRACVTLRHGIRPVRVRVLTRLDGTDVIERAIEVENAGATDAALSSLSPMAGGLQQVAINRQRVLPGEGMYRLGYMRSTTWGDEGNFGWVDLPDAGYAVYGRYRRDRHRHPMFVLENRLSGECFVAQFAWSGGYAFEFDLNLERQGSAQLSMDIRIDAPGPLRMLAPGEAYTGPAVHFGVVFGGLDPAIQAMHDHIRRSVFLPPTRGVSGWVEAGIGPEYDMDIESTLKSLEHASSVGAEVFFIDAGWYLEPNREEDWWAKCGDWRYNAQRYPAGIEQVREAVRAKGLLFGMWMDAERIGPKSECWRDHEDWIAKNYKGRPNGAGLLNLADPEVARWMEEQIVFLIEEYKIDMFRLDHNVGAPDSVDVNERGGYLENTFARYYENVYGMYRRLREKYPDVIFENCAGGGGRTDLGLTAGFTHSWVTDWQLHPNSLRITNGMTMALPPECVDRLIGGQAAYLTGDLNTQLRNMLFARPTIGMIRPNYAQENPHQMEAVRRHIAIYKEFVRPMHLTSRMYHHTPELAGPHAPGFGVLELAARDASRDMLGVFRLAEPEKEEVIVRPRGIDAGKAYSVTFDNSGARAVVSGFELAQRGLIVRLGGSLTSELILLQAIDEPGAR